MTSDRRFPIGAEFADGGVSFRVWAPRRKRVRAITGSSSFELQAEQSGYFSTLVPGLRAGDRYRFELDGEGPFPDPASRFQPDGPHGPSELIDPAAFRWTDSGWRGVPRKGQIVYELHVGAYTPEGTYAALAGQLPELADTGITVIELMPLADFAGKYNWGYDGVDLYAPTRVYGRPDDLRALIDRAHSLGVGVILDVVYNHLGPDGNYLPQYSSDFFTKRYENEWGEALNFDGPNCKGVREYFITNAAYWIREYHFDGLRMDATQQIFDKSRPHLFAEVAAAVRCAAGGRATFIAAENEKQHCCIVRPPEQGGHGMDALWNDDFHHSARVAMTGRNEAYYSDYLGRPQEFISEAKYGYLYQGQWYRWQKKRRGTPTRGLAYEQFVNCIENHDQAANSGRGQRVWQLTSPGRYRAMSALMLLLPGTPMLFQGQEFASSRPFVFFADHRKGLDDLVRRGRAEFMSQFRSVAEAVGMLPDPCAPETFQACKLDLGERRTHEPVYTMYKDLMRLRRQDPVFRSQGEHGIDGAVLGAESFLIRFFGDAGRDRLLIVNLGTDLHLDAAPEPLLAPPEQMCWSVLWSSEDPRYGGAGVYPPETEENWRIPGHAALALHPENA